MKLVFIIQLLRVLFPFFGMFERKRRSVKDLMDGRKTKAMEGPPAL